MSRQFAFISNVDEFPNPFLVEISRRTGTTRRQILYYQDKVTFCPSVLDPILRSILDNKTIFCRHRMLLKTKVLSLIEEEKRAMTVATESRPLSLQICITKCIETILYHEIFSRIGFLQTRKKLRTARRLLSDVQKIRKKRLRDERHLPVPFAADLQRSKQELNFVLESFRMTA
jgi:hypothetical protein